MSLPKTTNGLDLFEVLLNNNTILRAWVGQGTPEYLQKQFELAFHCRLTRTLWGVRSTQVLAARSLYCPRLSRSEGLAALQDPAKHVPDYVPFPAPAKTADNLNDYLLGSGQPLDSTEKST